MGEFNELEKYSKHFSVEDFWKKLAKFAKKAGSKVIYVALLLYYVMTSDNVPQGDKLKIAGALGYLILPIDLIPDTIPVLGFTDDLAALLFAYNSVKVNVTPEMKEKAKEQLKEWFGEIDEEDLNID